MTAPRFYCPIALQPHDAFALPDDIAHHAVRVLRLRDGAPLTLFDGTGGEYPATLEIQGRQATAHLSGRLDREAELTKRITLIQGLPASGKMDWIIEKAVELGVDTLIPIMAQRSPPQPDGARLQKRLSHWQRIVQSASEQCGRNRLMQITEPVSLQQHLRQPTPPGQTALLCHPESTDTLAGALTDAQAVALMIGPEGGWSEAELSLAQAAGTRRIRFGQRVLRTETAGLALVAATSALLGA